MSTFSMGCAPRTLPLGDATGLTSADRPGRIQVARIVAGLAFPSPRPYPERPTDLRDLLQRGETPNVDFKAPLAFEGDHCLELTKDVIAMANTQDGGTLVIGVSQDGAGGLRVDGLEPAQLETFDVTRIIDTVRSRSAPPVRLTCFVQEVDGNRVVVIQVQEFDEQPIVCTKDGTTSKNKSVFRQGDLLLRTAGAQSARVTSEAEMRQILRMGVRRLSDNILSDVAAILKGSPAQPPAHVMRTEVSAGA